jgi:hypothetical protein
MLSLFLAHHAEFHWLRFLATRQLRLARHWPAAFTIKIISRFRYLIDFYYSRFRRQIAWPLVAQAIKNTYVSTPRHYRHQIRMQLAALYVITARP